MRGTLKDRLEWGFHPITAVVVIVVAYVADIEFLLWLGRHQDAIEQAIGSVGWVVLGSGLAIPMLIFLFPWFGPVMLYSRLTKGRSGL